MVINGRVFVAKWRDRPGRPPATMQVWDLYVFDPPCGDCPTTPRGLGWQWCWDDVVKTIREEVRLGWVDQDYGPGGLTVVLGTDTFQTTSFIFEQGPVLWLKDDFELDSGRVVAWRDSSGHPYVATQTPGVTAPELVTIGDVSFVRFTGSEWLDLNIQAMPQWHCFIIGKVQSSLVNNLGTPFSASGLIAPYSGFEATISQTAALAPLGSLGTFISPGWVFGSLTSPVNSVTVWEWSQNESVSKVGLNAVSQTISTSSTLKTDVWNPMVLNGATPLPVSASIGRNNRGVTIGQEFSWLEGDIAEIIIYPYVLSSGQRTQVLNYLRSAYGLGAPIGLPNPVF